MRFDSPEPFKYDLSTIEAVVVLLDLLEEIQRTVNK